MPADEHKAKALFLAAIEKATAAERAAFLDGACAGEPELRRRVEALLQAHEEPDRLLGAPGSAANASDRDTSGPRAADLSPEELAVPGSRIGPYELLQRLGEGGMGVVYLAEQDRPVKRRVAVKVMKGGMESAPVIARFGQERQALAIMDHPNIARVFDAGTTDAGRPYFVMELVKGVPITRYCDQEQLTPRERLELFVPVCQAVQHAHQKGVIHRDLKPSNVLVAPYDGRPVPKVIDFGVAKATGPKLTADTPVTEVGVCVGTLEYMAPEQAELNNLDIDTRADVYSLGVLLYELLTGSPPFTPKQLRAAGYAEMMRLIREVDPPRPSTRLSASDELPGIAANRKLEPRRLTRLVQGELDWIVMKCLEKERARRYQTANGLAVDVLRYLADEPVAAGPPSRAYRLKKFLRRNRGPVVAASAILLLLLGGMVGTTMGLLRARQAERTARTDREDALKDRQRARKALDDLSSFIVEDWLGRQSGLTPEHKQLLELALVRYEEFTQETGDTPEQRSGLARAYCRVGNIRSRLGMPAEGAAALTRSIELYGTLVREYPGEPEYAEGLSIAHHNLGHLYRALRRLGDAFKAYDVARALDEELVREYPDRPLHAVHLGATYCSLGTHAREGADRPAALAWVDKAVATLEPVSRPEQRLPKARLFLSNAHLERAIVLAGLGRKADALKSLEAARALSEGLVRDYPNVRDYAKGLATALHNLALHQREMGQGEAALASHAAARSVLERLLREYPGVPDYVVALARAHNNVAVLQAELKRPREALASREAARGLLERLVRDCPDVAEHAANLATAHHHIALLAQELGQPREALVSHRAARALREQLVRDRPDVSDYAVALGGSCCNLGTNLRDRGDLDGALECYGKAIDVLGPLVEKEPALGEARLFLAYSYDNRGIVFYQLGKREEALRSYETARAHFERLIQDHPGVNEYTVDLGGTFCNVGNLLREGGQTDAALASYAQAVAALAAVPEKDPASAKARLFLGNTHTGRAIALERRGRQEEALESYEAARVVWEQLARDHPGVPGYVDDLAMVHNNVGNLLAGLGRRAEALKSLEAACALREPLVRDYPGATGYAIGLGGTYCNLGNLLEGGDDAETALAWYAKAIATLGPLVERQPKLTTARLFLHNTYAGRYDAHGRLRRHDEALKAIDRAIALDDSRNPRYRLKRAETLLRLGEYPRAADAAGEVAVTQALPPGDRYDLACVYSLCVPAAAMDARLSEAERDRLAEDYGGRAVAQLRRAIEAGYRDADHMKTDSDLDPLRQREDFRKLITELEASPKQPGRSGGPRFCGETISLLFIQRFVR
jgi:serine/threonine protein kinase/tetratricopeptide (TPR) repeat protein